MAKLVNRDAARLNPCLHEQNLSYECLSNNGYVQEKCELYFDNYNNCKKFWGKVTSERRAEGIKPYLPDVDDRPRIKAEYLANKNK